MAVEQLVQNFVTTIDSNTGTSDVFIVGGGSDYQAAVSVLRAAVYVTQPAIDNNPVILNIKLWTGFGDPTIIRQVGIVPDTVSGKFIDIIPQFSTTQGWALGVNEGLYLSVASELSSGDKLVVFGLCGKEMITV